jgi:hypothetical protein
MNRIEELTRKLFDGGLDESEASELAELLADTPDTPARHEVERALRGRREATEIGRKETHQGPAVADGDQQSKGSMSAGPPESAPATRHGDSGESCADSGEGVPTGSAVGSVLRRRMRVAELLVIAVGVVVLCVGIGYWWLSPPEPPGPRKPLRPPETTQLRLVPTIVRADAGVTVQRAETSIPGDTEFELQRGDVLLTVDGAGAAIKYEDTTHVAVSPQSRLVVQPSPEAKAVRGTMLLRLESGTITAERATQPQGRSFVILTANARVDAAGARFTTTAADGSTRVEVHKGRVKLTRVDDGKPVTVSGGQYAVVAKGNDLVARAMARAPATPIVLYRFDEGQGDRVHDVSAFGEPLDLVVHDPRKVRWFTESGLLLAESTPVLSDGSARKIYEACRTTNEITVEVWVAPAMAQQQGPARIVSLSADDDRRNFTLGHGRDGDTSASTTYVVRMRTTKTDANGRPATETPAGIAGSVLTQIVSTYSAAGSVRIYTDGVCRAEQEVGGDFSTWDSDYRLLLGDELTGGRAWLGTFHRLAIFDRALTEAEVQQNFAAGPRR